MKSVIKIIPAICIALALSGCSDIKMPDGPLITGGAGGVGSAIGAITEASPGNGFSVKSFDKWAIQPNYLNDTANGGYPQEDFKLTPAKFIDKNGTEHGLIKAQWKGKADNFGAEISAPLPVNIDYNKYNGIKFDVLLPVTCAFNIIIYDGWESWFNENGEYIGGVGRNVYQLFPENIGNNEVRLRESDWREFFMDFRPDWEGKFADWGESSANEYTTAQNWFKYTQHIQKTLRIEVKLLTENWDTPTGARPGEEQTLYIKNVRLSSKTSAPDTPIYDFEVDDNGANADAELVNGTLDFTVAPQPPLGPVALSEEGDAYSFDLGENGYFLNTDPSTYEVIVSDDEKVYFATIVSVDELADLFVDESNAALDITDYTQFKVALDFLDITGKKVTENLNCALYFLDEDEESLFPLDGDGPFYGNDKFGTPVDIPATMTGFPSGIIVMVNKLDTRIAYVVIKELTFYLDPENITDPGDGGGDDGDGDGG